MMDVEDIILQVREHLTPKPSLMMCLEIAQKIEVMEKKKRYWVILSQEDITDLELGQTLIIEQPNGAEVVVVYKDVIVPMLEDLGDG